MIEQYIHHNRLVYVKSELKGKHREHCLCYICKDFYPENSNSNCVIAQMLFTICKEYNVVTPVYECFHFKEKEEASRE